MSNNMDLYDDIRTIKGIGDKKAQAFNRLGVFSLYELISYFPYRYEDRSVCKPLALTSNGEQCSISVIIADEPHIVRIKRGLNIVKFKVADESGTADISYFNQPYMKDNLHRGDECRFYGKIELNGNRRSISNPVFEKAEKTGSKTGRIIPVYRLTSGLNQNTVLQSITQGLNECSESLTELLPAPVLSRNRLVGISEAYRQIHFPTDFTALENARKRLIFEELFVLSCALERMSLRRKTVPGIRFNSADFDEFYSSLPFTPTSAQRRAVDDATEDMCSGKLMNRLIQGDVGSGKTLCAAALSWLTFKNGYCSAFMVPTEILAEQHYDTLSRILSPLGMRVGLLTGSMREKDKKLIREKLLAGEYDLIIGTHALISASTGIERLGLVITDEQHRFGVDQRSALSSKGSSPHVLVMSATPIPRSLALIIFGDLDVSIIDELPPGRTPVDTFAVDSRYRERLNAFIQKQADGGHQIFIVCPKVESESDDSVLSSGGSAMKSAEEYCQYLRAALPRLNIECIHGRMKTAEKESIMQSFSAGKTDVLVATTVIEVGVDVPNATLMIIENAERFGLSQLHQLRGRVGRGQEKSYCVLVSDSCSEDAKSRLKIMCETNDGFKIAEEDLRLRGPGDFFGSRQHGLPEMHLADLGADTAILKKAQNEAKLLLNDDPLLELPENRNLSRRIESILASSDRSGRFS